MKKQSSATLSQDIDKEDELVEGLINNNAFAYEALVRQYSAKMYTLAWRFFPTDDDAQECLQKAFIQVFNNITSFKKNSPKAANILIYFNECLTRWCPFWPKAKAKRVIIGHNFQILAYKKLF